MAHFRKRTHKGAIRWDVTVTRKGAPRQSKTFQTKADAERWGRETEREIDRGAWQSTDMAERLTVGKLIERYRDQVLPAKKSATRLQSVANKIIDSDLARLPLIALTPKRVALHRDDRLATRARNGGKNGKLRKNTLSTQTVRHEITLLKRAIDEAVREWGLYLPAGNPASIVRLPSMGRPRDRRLTPGEFERLMRGHRSPEGKWPGFDFHMNQRVSGSMILIPFQNQWLKILAIKANQRRQFKFAGDTGRKTARFNCTHVAILSREFIFVEREAR